MDGKMLPRFFFPRSSPWCRLPQHIRIRHLAIALVLILLFLYFPSRNVPTRKNPHRIQASFPRESSKAKTVRLQRREQVKEAFEHAWKGYKEHAWLHDEVRPISGGQADPFVGWAATLIDGLDSLYIMGMKDEFEGALRALEQIDFTTPNGERVPVFETTIRYLGGLLGAWDISGHNYLILLEKAKELGDFLYGAFHTESGIPTPYYWWEKNHTEVILGENGVLVAQIGSLSLEFIRLSQVTGDPKYAAAIQRVTDHLDEAQNNTALPGMWPSKADCMGSRLSFSSRSFTLGAFADSAFEYLPKTSLLLSPSPASKQYLDMYRFALSSFSTHLFFRPRLPGNPDILFPGSAIADHNPPELQTEIQHLACFVGGMVALGSRISHSPKELEIGRKLTDGCVWAYTATPSGIMPEVFHVDRCPDPKSCIFEGEGSGFSRIDDSSYQLRPEAIESVFIMYRLTADKSWQEKGWKMFEAIAKHSRTDIAHARLKDVMEVNPTKQDSMESFWLAETLKYFYLLFSDPEIVSLDDYVLNTEAHPLRQGSA